MQRQQLIMVAAPIAVAALAIPIVAHQSDWIDKLFHIIYIILALCLVDFVVSFYAFDKGMINPDTREWTLPATIARFIAFAITLAIAFKIIFF